MNTFSCIKPIAIATITIDYDDDISYMLIRHVTDRDAQTATEGSNAHEDATVNRHYQRSLTRRTYEAISDQNPDRLLNKQFQQSKRKLPVANSSQNDCTSQSGHSPGSHISQLHQLSDGSQIAQTSHYSRASRLSQSSQYSRSSHSGQSGSSRLSRLTELHERLSHIIDLVCPSVTMFLKKRKKEKKAKEFWSNTMVPTYFVSLTPLARFGSGLHKVISLVNVITRSVAGSTHVLPSKKDLPEKGRRAGRSCVRVSLDGSSVGIFWRGETA